MGASPAQGMTLQPESQHFVVSYKRLERGRFRTPRVTQAASHVEMDATALAMLLDGIDVSRVRRAEHWQPPAQKTA